jgi:hypothetical protein
VRIYLWISLGGFVVLAGMDALFFVLHDGLGGLVFLYLASYWTAACLIVGFALLAATGIQRFAKRIAKPSQS